MPTGKVIDFISGQSVPASSEEIDATQPLLALLVGLGWPVGQVRARPQWRVPKTPSDATRRELNQSFQNFPCDIVIFNKADQHYQNVLIICECKKPALDAGAEQLKTYLNLEPAARIGIWFNGKQHAIVYRDGQGGYEVDDTSPLPRPGESLDYARPDRVLRIRNLVNPPSMKILFESVRDYLAAQDEKVSRDELLLMDLASLLMCKLLDERDKQDSPDAVLEFQLQSPEGGTGPHIRKLFARIQQQYPAMFPDDGQGIEITDRSITYVVRKLQPYRFLGHSRQSVGDAFQVLRGKAVLGAEGQYFTPGPVVRAAVRILNPTERDRIIDPAGGTGGFVAMILDHVYQAIEASGQRAEERKLRWVGDRLFMIDKDAVGVRLAKSYLTLMNNGSHIYQADSIRPTSPTAAWDGRRDDLDRQVRPGTFDMVLTNPPFGENLLLSLADGRREGYSFSHRWRRDSKTGTWSPEAGEWQDRQLGLIFLERCLELLAPDGRLGIVLPETFLFSRDFEWLVDYLTRAVTIEYVLNLPMVTFEQFCRAKTCLVFLRKRTPPPNHRIVFSYPESIGFDKHGKARFAVHSDGTITDQVDDELTKAVDELITLGAPGATVATPTKYHIPIAQAEAAAKRILLPQYYWRSPIQTALDGFRAAHNCECITLGELEDAGFISARSGHGSPSPAFHGKGPVPYIKVINITNWRIAEKSAYGVPEAVAARLWGKNGPDLAPFELITPNRASKTIGRWAVIMPWQLRLLLTKEFLRLRVANPLPSDPTNGLLAGFNWAFLLYALSLKVVIDQYRCLVFMQTNREDLGPRWREVILPLPRAGLATWSDPVGKYFDGLVRAKVSRDQFLPETGHDLADWPL